MLTQIAQLGGERQGRMTGGREARSVQPSCARLALSIRSGAPSRWRVRLNLVRGARRGYVFGVLERRWRTLIIIAFAVALADQASKFWAVEHLTPGIALAGTPTSPEPRSPGGRSDWEARLRQKSIPERVRDFYRVRSPCDGFGRCPAVVFAKGFWEWHYAENPGAAWSLLAHADAGFRRVFLVGFSLAALGFIGAFIGKMPEEQHLLQFALSLIAGGALGNLIDRVRLGYVIDFVEWHLGTLRWPTFNLADAAISTGIGLWILDTLIQLRRSKNQHLAPPVP